jgi:sec-independent protein translocase protein TatB
MPSFQDSAILVFLALLLFGPKKLPELARQLGKLMAEFRRASNEFRMQMEDELRIADQQEQQKKIAEMQAAAPIAPVIPAEVSESSITTSTTTEIPVTPERISQMTQELIADHQPGHTPATEPLPIATSGGLNLMPPATGLPVSNSALSPVLDSIPQTPDPEPVTVDVAVNEASHHG